MEPARAVDRRAARGDGPDPLDDLLIFRGRGGRDRAVRFGAVLVLPGRSLHHLASALGRSASWRLGLLKSIAPRWRKTSGSTSGAEPAASYEAYQRPRRPFMKFGVLGTGMVGSAIANKLVALGHEVKMGSREAGNEKARKWMESAGKGASAGTFAEAAKFGEIVFSATLGEAAIAALRAAGKENLRGKVLVDVSNPLDFSKGMPPRLFTAATGDSLGERIQKELPDTKVVKALNTVNANVMGDPTRVRGESDLFISGNDAEAKKRVTALLNDFGWRSVIDIGDITGARGMEAYLLLWLPLYGALKTADFNVRVVR
jgi:8-hydroxy-5-deazaflavin:NADPH oxidoreductase